MLKKFTGFKGVCAFAQIGDIQFALVASNQRQLNILWTHIMETVPLDPAGVKKAILIEANLLPDPPKPRASRINPDSTPTIEV